MFIVSVSRQGGCLSVTPETAGDTLAKVCMFYLKGFSPVVLDVQGRETPLDRLLTQTADERRTSALPAMSSADRANSLASSTSTELAGSTRAPTG